MKSPAKQYLFFFFLAVALVLTDAAAAFAQSGAGGLGQIPFATIRFGLECRDSIDNNGDGLVDTNDPNCVSNNDSSEMLPGTQADEVSIKDISCDGREDVLGINMVAPPFPGLIAQIAWAPVQLAWKTLLCPAKVDRNCDGRSDVAGTPVYTEPHHQDQCPKGYSVTKSIDRDCNGLDDRYPTIDVRRTDYWNQICPDPGKYSDANCDGYDDKLKIDLLNPMVDPNGPSVWYSLCPAKVDHNCDGRADISGIKYFKEYEEAKRNKTDLADWELVLRQCPGGVKPAPDRDCNGQDDRALYYIPAQNPRPGAVPPTCLQIADPNYKGPLPPEVGEPVCLDITNTDYWKNYCAKERAFVLKDADCDGIEDDLKVPLLTDQYEKAWAKLCPAKIDRNCDGYSDATGQEYSGAVDKNENRLKLSDEPHHKYQCPNGFSIEGSGGNRDATCDGYDDVSYTESRMEYVNGEYKEVQYREQIDLTNTDYWKRQCLGEQSVIGSSPFSRFGGANIDADFIRENDVSCSEAGFRFDSFESIICTIRNIVARILLPFFFILATLFFMYGVVKYYMAAPSTAARQEGRKYMIWAVIALFVMVSVWGIISLVTGVLGFKSILPQLKVE